MTALRIIAAYDNEKSLSGDSDNMHVNEEDNIYGPERISVAPPLCH